MTKKFNIKRILTVALAAVVFCVGAVFPVHADEDKEHKVFPSVSPTYTKVTLDPGETYNGTFDIGNIGSETFTFKIYADPYVEVGDSAEPSYGNPTKYSQITDWITFDQEGATIAPGEKAKISYSIKVPNDAPGGGQYAALVAEAKNVKDGTGDVQIENITRVAHLLYATINGETNECAKILDNNVNTFMFEPPITANSLVENCGNIHQNITYTMKVYPLFSDQPIYTNEEEPMVRVVLPEARRFNMASWTKEDGAPMIGIYNVEQTVKVGKEVSTVKKLVFIFPLWLLIIFLLLVGAIVFWLVSRSCQRKESKRSSVNTPDRSSN